MKNNWLSFTKIEVIIIFFMITLGFTQNIIMGFVMFILGLIIHTLTFLIIKNRNSQNSDKEKEVQD